MTGVPIFFVDQDLLVIDKPAGLLSLPDGYDQSLQHVKSVFTQDFGELWIVHRLDRDTSGVMVLARNAEAHKSLNSQFESRKVNKIYTALVIGRPEWEQKSLRLPLRINVGRRHRTAVDLDRGKEAITHVTVTERLLDYCLVEAKPETGRRHQIRAHLASEGYPIACDGLYGNQFNILLSDVNIDREGDTNPTEPVMNRIALHARSIEFFHPSFRQLLNFEAPLPADIQHLLKLLRP